MAAVVIIGITTYIFTTLEKSCIRKNPIATANKNTPALTFTVALLGAVKILSRPRDALPKK